MIKIIIILLIVIWLIGSAYLFAKTWKRTDILLLSKIVVIAFWPAFALADFIEERKKKKNEVETHINETSTDRIQDKT